MNAQEETEMAVELVRVGGDFSSPIALLSPPDGTNRLFVVDEIGTIHIINPDGTQNETPFLDLTEFTPEFSRSRNDPRGLLSLAFHPQYAENGRFFVTYTPPAPGAYDHLARVSEFHVSDDPNVADAASERVLLEVTYLTIEHSAGQLVFDDNGYLFISLGDDFNPEDTAQNMQDLRGSLLRIDVDTPVEGQPYAIPADNPYADGVAALPEIYAKGLRHPWRMSFDAETNQLYVSDPAWTFRASRVYIAEPGANYGWELQAGLRCFAEDDPTTVLADCSGEDGMVFAPPIIEYGQEFGRIIIGGGIYRGSAIPALQGQYIGGEWGVQVTGGAKLFAAAPSDTPGERWALTQLTFPDLPVGTAIWSIGTDSQGEMYVLTMSSPVVGSEGGAVYKIVPAGN